MLIAQETPEVDAALVPEVRVREGELEAAEIPELLDAEPEAAGAEFAWLRGAALVLVELLAWVFELVAAELVPEFAAELRAGALAAEELAEVLAEEAAAGAASEPPGMVSRSPGKIRVEDNPFSLIRADTVVPCCSAMWLRVSPETTVWTALEAADAEELEELELLENDRFCPG